MIIKKKSVIVVLVSSFVISSVMILTLISYAVYIRFKDNGPNAPHSILLHKLNPRGMK